MAEGYIYSSSHNTRGANHIPAPQHGRRTLGDRLIAPATARPVRKKQKVEYDPDFGDNGDVWQRAEARSIKAPARPPPPQSRVPHHSQAAASSSSLPQDDFSGVLDHLSADTMVNEHGFPLNADDVLRLRREQNEERTSQGKVG